MAAAISTVTKTASVVKTTKGSEKKWSEILSMNRRHDLQLPMDIAKYDHDLKRTFNIHQRQKYHTERTWANKHETWYHDDVSFRDQFLQQLKPITRRFKHIDSLTPTDNYGQQQKQQQQDERILNDSEMELLSSTIMTTSDRKEKFMRELPPLKQNKKRSTIRHFQNYSGEDIIQSNGVLSKLLCPKILHEYEPRLYSHAHASFLDVAQRFINRKPETIEKRADNKNKQKQQKQYYKFLIDNEQERTRLAAAKFQQRLDDDKNKENNYNNLDDDKDSYYTRPF
ncbi:unnamed protein product [Rotaria socialis]|uniref:Uncharacterized protein n=1 Tax=Rotaria socialis TaxID=392032 RepID=A0A817P9K5_9BILA|nr:unnamed protein product [Rotaria socialis]CAF3369841.1 unnamed protein product [Rotaria socialis]CAF3521456.1 unnamed protein product [Rotaria socialis]CAF3527381.1 unnamed protein product [Rotaria socialis]CAF3594240.1 unnamed protein product [Rotaria socialis]